MTCMQLSLETLDKFDFGKASIAWQKGLERVVRDLLDRPGDTNKRTVTLEAVIKPVRQQDGDVVDAEVEFVVVAKIPPHRTHPRPLVVSLGGQLFFEELAPDNPRQSTLEMEPE